MMYAGRAVLAVALVAVSVAAMPNHLKAIVVDSDPVPVHVVKEVVPVVREPAGTPGYSVHASADSSASSASAGLGDTGPSVTVGSKPGSVAHKPVVYTGPGFFDNIFNIPISVLQSVNTYLNNRGPITKPAYRRRGHHPVVQDKVATPVEQTIGVSDASSSASASASASATAGAAADGGSGGEAAHSSQHQGTTVIQKRVNYDEIFNIPIAALKSVNQLLNG